MCNLALISSERKSFRVAKRYAVTQADREAYARRYWRLPTRLAGDGDLAELWQLGEAVPSVLAVLALHAFPEPGAEWSQPIDLHHERIATLAGAHRVTVVAALAALCEKGLVRQATREHPTEKNWQLRRFYVKASLYASGGEPYVSVDGSFIYDQWRYLPSHTARHLRLVEMALAPVHYPDAYLAALPPNEREAAVQRIESYEPSLHELSRASGVSRDAIRRVRREAKAREEVCGWMDRIAIEEEERRLEELDFYTEVAERPIALDDEGVVSATTALKRGVVSAAGINPFITTTNNQLDASRCNDRERGGYSREQQSATSHTTEQPHFLSDTSAPSSQETHRRTQRILATRPPESVNAHRRTPLRMPRVRRCVRGHPRAIPRRAVWAPRGATIALIATSGTCQR
jgi:hypothetical protein